MFLVILDHFGIAEEIDGGMIRVRPLSLWFHYPGGHCTLEGHKDWALHSANGGVHSKTNMSEELWHRSLEF